MKTRNSLTILLLLPILLSAFSLQGDFLKEQKKFSRVRNAISEKQTLIASTLKEANIGLNELNILIIAYKEEDILEIHGKRKSDLTFKLLSTYEICSKSGELGPKRAQGDLQVPEGFYHIDRFNPSSNYHLALGINYPNASDKIKGKAGNLGGDIFIHGACVTIGCLPMTDDKIKEIYLYALYARDNEQTRIPVYIFPFRLDEKGFQIHADEYKNRPELLNFWRNLKKGYDTFKRTSKELNYSVNRQGDYVIH